MQRPDGSLGWTLSRAIPILDARGEIAEWFGAATDVTERKHAEQSRNESEERFRTLFASAPVGVFVCDKDAVIQNYNQLAVELWGRAPTSGEEKYCGSTSLWLPSGERLPQEQSLIAAVLRTGVPAWNVELLVERPDGSRIPVLANYAVLRDTEGEITGAISTFVNISERKLAETALLRLAAIVECADDAIITMDINGTIETWNPGAERLFGYPEQEAIGTPITMLIPADHLEEETDLLAKIRRGEHIQHYESIRRRKDGRLLNVSLTISPLVDGRGHIVGASKIARDSTDRKLAEAALMKSEKLAAAGRLAAVLAHEINNPLQAVTNLMAILAQSPKMDTQDQEYAKMAADELGRVTHLTQQSLSFYRESTSPAPSI